MSVKIMGAVWDSDLPQDEKYVALAYADHAEHDGSNVFPSNELIAWKTGYSVRQVQRIRSKLVGKGILESVADNKGGRNRSNRYRFVSDALPPREEWRIIRDRKHDKLTPITETENHDIPAETMTFETGNHDKAMSWDPSLSVNIDPSLMNPQEEVLTPEEKVKQRVMAAMAAGARKEVDLRDKIRTLFLLTPNWELKTNRSFLLWLKERPAGQEIEGFARWWYEKDWRGVQGQPPSLKQIQDLWLNAFETVTVPGRGQSPEEASATLAWLQQKPE